MFLFDTKDDYNVYHNCITLLLMYDAIRLMTEWFGDTMNHSFYIMTSYSAPCLRLE